MEKQVLFAHKPQKNAGFIKKKDLLAEKQDLFEKKMRGKVPSQEKRFQVTKKQELQKQKSIKTGFISEKRQ